MHPQIRQPEPGNCPICGMTLELSIKEASSILSKEYQSMRKRLIVGILLTIPLIFLSMGGINFLPAKEQLLNANHWLQLALSTPVVLWCGLPFFQSAWHALLQARFNMFTLISIGVAAAFVFSTAVLIFPQILPQAYTIGGHLPLYFESAAVITTLVLLGQVLEMKARAKTGQSIRSLLNKTPKKGVLVKEGQENEISIDRIQIGDLLRVKPGATIPVDGRIVEGFSHIDESMVTGESTLVKKIKGDLAIGGTINQTGSFLMKAEKVGNETLLAKIIQMVSKAQASRAPIQAITDKIAAYFVPVVLFIAVGTFVIWGIYGPYPSWIYAMINAISVLIIACPCALGLATPMSIMVGMGRGAETGVLIKNAESLEKLTQVKTLVIDKTGTLTEGKPSVAQIVARQDNKIEVLRLAASLEKFSEHPLASAIVAEASKLTINLSNALDFKAFPGEGIKGIVEGKNVLVGTANFLKRMNFNIDEDQLKTLLSQLEDPTQTMIYVGIVDSLEGLITVSDPVKKDVGLVLDEIHRLGLKVVILSGDNKQVTEALSKKLNIDEFHGEVNPAQKNFYLKNLQNDKNLVAMAGDGINDAPALAAADVGIAMGTGTDVAIETADVVLLKGDLKGIPKAIRLSEKTVVNIRQNLFFAFIYNIIGIPIAAGILYPWTGYLLNPMFAALAMSLSSVSVIANALRLRKVKI